MKLLLLDFFYMKKSSWNKDSTFWIVRTCVPEDSFKLLHPFSEGGYSDCVFMGFGAKEGGDKGIWD